MSARVQSDTSHNLPDTGSGFHTTDLATHFLDDGIRKTQQTVMASELRSCVKVEVAVMGSQSLIGLMVSVDVKQN